MAGTITVDTIQSDSSYNSVVTIPSKVNFTGGMQVGGQDTTFGGMRNRIINGDMRIDQRYNGSANTPPNNGDYNLDRWALSFSQSSKISIQRSSDAPSGFSNSAIVTTVSATSAGTNDYWFFRQKIEGYNVADLDYGLSTAKTVTLSFWVKSSLSGTFSGSIINNSSSRSYSWTYTISSVNTWEYKTVTIPGCTDGTWEKTSNCGLEVRFSLGVGTTYGGTPGSWSVANYTGATGCVNMVGTNAATWQVTGVQVEKGSATSFEYRQYQQELALCQRYYWQDSNLVYYPGLLDGAADYPMAFVKFPVTMRTASPSGNFLSIGAFYYNNGTGGTSFTPAGGTQTSFSTSTDTFGGLQRQAISNSPGSSHGQKAGQWYVKVAVSAEL